MLVGEQDGIAVWSGLLVRSAPSHPYDIRSFPDIFWGGGKKGGDNRERAGFRAAREFVGKHVRGAPSCPYEVAATSSSCSTSPERVCFCKRTLLSLEKFT